MAALGAKNGIGRDVRFVDERDLNVAHLAHPADEAGAVLFAQPLLGHCGGGHHRGGQACRGAAAAARVAQAVLAPVGVVGMTGAKGVEQVGVVAAARILVADHQRDRRAGGHALVQARQDLDGVGLVALRHVAAGAGAAAVEVGLDVGLAQRHAGWAAVDHAADGRAMALAEVGDAKQVAEGAAGHEGLKEKRAAAQRPRPVIVAGALRRPMRASGRAPRAVSSSAPRRPRTPPASRGCRP